MSVPVDDRHDPRFLSDRLDRGFFRSAATGYMIGFPLIGLFVFLTLELTTEWDTGVVLAVALAVAFWVGLLVAVILIGIWTARNEHALFPGSSGEAEPREW